MTRLLYSFLIRCAAPFAFATLLWRGLRDRGYWQGLPERFGLGATITHAPTIWLHAVSLGEMSAAAPLIRSIMANHPEYPVVLTAATPAGRARAQALFADAADIRFLPYDTPGSVRRFLARVRPQLGVIMETELWPNLFEQSRQRGIPLLLASARLSAKSVSRYRRWGALFGGVFKGDVAVAAQSVADAERFVAIGAAAAKTHVIGNVKFDLQPDPVSIEQGRRLRASFGNRAVWVAGSTHAGEDELMVESQAAVRAQRPDALLVLVPRHKDRFAGIADLLTRRGVKFARRSSREAVDDDTQVLLGDTLGELPTFYAAADAAFVGGSLIPIGGHNLLEPAALGLPVLTGPSYFNGKEIAKILLQEGAAIEVGGASELAANLLRLFNDPAEAARRGGVGMGVLAANRGSVQKLAQLIEASLAQARARDPGPTPAAYPSAGN
ncbi:MAG TPA: lipid IV(A) 3-deoxy-D-manno-octulosonic acid transferase [Steroidobacteraceae bacterium]